MAIKFTRILTDLILESSRFEILYDKWVKPNREKKNAPKMPFEIFKALVLADPTSRVPQGEDIDSLTVEKMQNVNIGKYTQWLIKTFMSPKLEVDYNDPNIYKQELKRYRDLFMEDLYKVTEDLTKYERFKNRLPQEARDINKLTPETLYDQVKDFSLEKTKASKEEKKEASKTYAHPGADIVYRGSDWTVAKISDQGQLGKDAAIFYGGSHLTPTQGETRWCTSSPGLNWFENYIKKGPLYVVIPNSPQKFTGSMDVGETSGLPALRYQFHFPDNQYMDPADRQINLIDFLLKQEEGLRNYFKPEFLNGLIKTNKVGGARIEVNWPNDSASKFIKLYGANEFFDLLPVDIVRIDITNSSNEQLTLDVPDSIARFQNLEALNLIGCINKVPEAICKLKNLQFLSFPKNPNLEMLPSCIADLQHLSVLNIPVGASNIVPQAVIDREQNDDDFFIFPPVSM